MHLSCGRIGSYGELGIKMGKSGVIFFLRQLGRLSLSVAPCSTMHRIIIFLLSALLLSIALCASVQAVQPGTRPVQRSAPVRGSLMDPRSSSPLQPVLSSTKSLLLQTESVPTSNGRVTRAEIITDLPSPMYVQLWLFHEMNFYLITDF